MGFNYKWKDSDVGECIVEVDEFNTRYENEKIRIDIHQLRNEMEKLKHQVKADEESEDSTPELFDAKKILEIFENCVSFVKDEDEECPECNNIIDECDC